MYRYSLIIILFSLCSSSSFAEKKLPAIKIYSLQDIEHIVESLAAPTKERKTVLKEYADFKSQIAKMLSANMPSKEKLSSALQKDMDNLSVLEMFLDEIKLDKKENCDKEDAMNGISFFAKPPDSDDEPAAKPAALSPSPSPSKAENFARKIVNVLCK